MKGLRQIIIFASLIASLLLIDYLQKQQMSVEPAFSYECGTYSAPSQPTPKEFTTREFSASSGPRTITVISGVPSSTALPSFLKKRETSSIHFPVFENHPAVRSFYSIGIIRI